MVADIKTSFNVTCSVFSSFVKEVMPETSLDWLRAACAIFIIPLASTVFIFGDISWPNSPLMLKSVLKFPFTNPAIGA